jgi:hypothetical protein
MNSFFRTRQTSFTYKNIYKEGVPKIQQGKFEKQVVSIFLESSSSDDPMNCVSYLTVGKRWVYFPFDCARLPLIESEMFVALKC